MATTYSSATQALKALRESEKTVKTYHGCALAILTVIALPFAVYWRAYVLVTLWAWLIVPAFGLPALTVGSAVCLIFVLGYLKGYRKVKTDDSEDANTRMATDIVKMFSDPAFALGFGWLVMKAIERGWLVI